MSDTTIHDSEQATPASGAVDEGTPAPIAGDGSAPVAASTARLPGSLGGALLAEAFGTFVIALAVIAAGPLVTQLSGGLGSLHRAIISGLALFLAYWLVGSVSGGHFNPAVTLGAAITRRLDWLRALYYVLAQLVGAILAAGVLVFVVPDSQQFPTHQWLAWGANGFDTLSPAYTATQQAVQFGQSGAFVFEALLTALLVVVFLRATRGHAPASSSTLSVGSADAGILPTTAGVAGVLGASYALASYLLEPLTNAGLNPARSTAAMLFAQDWSSRPGWDSYAGQLWLFWVAPLVGAAIAGLFYLAFSGSDDPAAFGTGARLATDDDPTEYEEPVQPEYETPHEATAAQPAASEAGPASLPGADSGPDTGTKPTA